jgi:hypothetical protein
MDLPELLLYMFIAFAVFIAFFLGLWLFIPVAVLAWVLMPAADKVATDLVNTSAPGSVPALGCGLATILLAGGVILLAFIAVAIEGGAI